MHINSSSAVLIKQVRQPNWPIIHQKNSPLRFFCYHAQKRSLCKVNSLVVPRIVLFLTLRFHVFPVWRLNNIIAFIVQRQEDLWEAALSYWWARQPYVADGAVKHRSAFAAIPATIPGTRSERRTKSKTGKTMYRKVRYLCSLLIYHMQA